MYFYARHHVLVRDLIKRARIGVRESCFDRVSSKNGKERMNRRDQKGFMLSYRIKCADMHVH